MPTTFFREPIRIWCWTRRAHSLGRHLTRMADEGILAGGMVGWSGEGLGLGRQFSSGRSLLSMAPARPHALCELLLLGVGNIISQGLRENALKKLKRAIGHHVTKYGTSRRTRWIPIGDR